MVDNIINILNSPWAIALGSTIIGGLVVALVVHRLQNKKQDQANSITRNNLQHSNGNNAPIINGSGNNVSIAGHDIVHGDKVINKTPQFPIPEIHLQLNGRGATESFQGHIEKQTPGTLVILHIEIDGVKTDIGRPFTKLMHLDNLKFDPHIFTQQQGSIVVRVRYRDLEGNVYEHRQTAIQEKMAVGKFNILLQGDIHLNRVNGAHESAKFFTMPNWLASRTNNDQGSDWRELNLAGNSVDKLMFTVTPSSPYWRAGFKLLDPNGAILPFLSPNSLIFHIQSTDRETQYGITVYKDGVQVNDVPKTGPTDRGKPIQVSFEVSPKNFIKVYVNDILEFEPSERIDPRILKRVCIMAWGDENNYEVGISDVKFSLRT